jgi:hypothetical protein
MTLRIVACHPVNKCPSDRRKAVFQKRRERLTKVFDQVRKIAEMELAYVREILDDVKKESPKTIDPPSDLE